MHICGIWKNGTHDLICKAAIETQTVENECMDTKGERGGEELGDWD